MSREVDARGLKCPKPVMLARDALQQDGPFLILVDNETARDNVERFARSSGCEVTSETVEGGFSLTVTPPECEKTEGEPGVPYSPVTGGPSALLVTSDVIGSGDRELGRTLIKMFLYTCSQSGRPPDTVVFMHSGVFLVTRDKETAGHVRELERTGSRVLVCGTCLDFYGLKDALGAGTVSNMYEIEGALRGAAKVLSL